MSVSSQHSSCEPLRLQLSSIPWSQEKDKSVLMKLLGGIFRVEPPEVDAPIIDSGLYLIMGNQRNYLVRTDSPAVQGGLIPLWLVVEQQKIKPLEVATFRKSAADGRVLRLIDWSDRDEVIGGPVMIKSARGTAEQGAIEEQPAIPEQGDKADPEEVELDENETAKRDMILDMGAFSQLVEAAQRSGIVPGISTIVQVRDCEFRLGRYQQALQTMESMFSGFTGNVMQRQQRLAREDAEIASGRLKMSPRELQAKRVRDNQGNEAIERARTRFSRVLDGLRLLLHNQEHPD